MREGRFYTFWVYIMGSRTGTIYVGMSGFLAPRVRQHKSGEIEGFTKKSKASPRNTSVTAWSITRFMTAFSVQKPASGN